MREIVLTLPDQVYEKLVAKAASAHRSPEQWIVDSLLNEQLPQVDVEDSHMLFTAALDALGFKRLEPKKTKRLNDLLQARKERILSEGETTELTTLMTEADTLELESLQRIVTTLER